MLHPGELDALAGRPGLIEFVAGLAQTDYARDVELARERFSGIVLVDEALRRNLSRRLRGVRRFFATESSQGGSRSARLVAVVLARYDVANLVGVLRGRAGGGSWADIQAALLPAGELDLDQLALLAEQSDMARFIALLKEWSIPYAATVAKALDEDHGPLVQVELAVRRSFQDWAAAQLQSGDANTALARDWLLLEADASNLIALIRLVYRAARPDLPSVTTLFVPGGTLPLDRFAALLTQPTVEDLLAAFGRSRLGAAASAALRRRLHSDEAVALEWGIERFLARWASAQAYRDPLGIGLLLAYHAEKVEEVRSLRLIARGLERGWRRERLRDLLAPVAA